MAKLSQSDVEEGKRREKHLSCTVLPLQGEGDTRGTKVKIKQKEEEEMFAGMED